MNVSFIRDMREQIEIRQKATTVNKIKDRRIKNEATQSKNGITANNWL